jgi:hypothetical protein
MVLPSAGVHAERPGRGPTGAGRRRPTGKWAFALFAAGIAVLVAVPLALIILTHGSGAAVSGGLVAGETQQLPGAGPTGSAVAGLHPITSAGPSGCAPACSPSSPVQPAAVPPAVADPSGQAMPVGDLPGWRQVFTDNFAVPVPLGSFPQAVSSKWQGYDGLKDTSGNGTYLPGQVVSISGGLMNLHLHTADGRAMVAAPIARIPGAGRGGGMLYGRYAMRFRADPVSGYKTAWLLWPDTDHWPDGEIDFPEGDLTGTIMAAMHHTGDPQNSDNYGTKIGYSSWHTAVVEWTAQSVTFYLDGKVLGRFTDASVIPTTPMHWVLQTETSLTAAAPPASAAGNVQIDWVAAWAKA